MVTHYTLTFLLKGKWILLEHEAQLLKNLKYKQLIPKLTGKTNLCTKCKTSTNVTAIFCIDDYITKKTNMFINDFESVYW